MQRVTTVVHKLYTLWRLCLVRLLRREAMKCRPLKTLDTGRAYYERNREKLLEYGRKYLETRIWEAFRPVERMGR